MYLLESGALRRSDGDLATALPLMATSIRGIARHTASTAGRLRMVEPRGILGAIEEWRVRVWTLLRMHDPRHRVADFRTAFEYRQEDEKHAT